jgi:hypothetical protein
MIPLGGWANRQLAALAEGSGSSEIAKLTGSGLLAERALLGGFCVPGDISAGGGCKLYRTADGMIALNLSRPDDRDLLPALFENAEANEADVAAHIAAHPEGWLVARGRELGMAIAGVSENRSVASAAVEMFGLNSDRPAPARPPRILDLSALWAGPLVGRLLRLAGGSVAKLESRSRPDALREGDPALFERLNTGKRHVGHDLQSAGGVAALRAEIADADIIIEAARPRALLQMGIDVEAEVHVRPSLIWLTITGHGVRGDAANWVGFGDDAGVAGGLTAALRQATGKAGFVGDAIADPLTGIFAARTAWDAWCAGTAGRFVFSMSAIVAQALSDETAHDPAGLKAQLLHWSTAVGTPFSTIG